MAAKKDISHKINKTTIIAYSLIIILITAFFSISGFAQSTSTTSTAGAGSGCSGCGSSCKDCCCCAKQAGGGSAGTGGAASGALSGLIVAAGVSLLCGPGYLICFAVFGTIFSALGALAGCTGTCGCNKNQFTVVNPYTGSPMSSTDYYCLMGSMPSVPTTPTCNPPGTGLTYANVLNPASVDTKLCDEQRGVCKGAKQTCGDDGEWPGCDATSFTSAAYESGTETLCDGLDNNCDGHVDEGCDADHDGYCTQDMRCSVKFHCGSGGTCTDCDDDPTTGISIHPGAAEVCDAGQKDENCNSEVNEGCACIDGTVDVCSPYPNSVCAEAKRKCANGQWSVGECSSLYASISGYRATETGPWCADSKDNNCNGKADCDDSSCVNYIGCIIQRTPP